MKPILDVACVGDSSNPNVFGGMPYHLVKAGRRAELVRRGLSLTDQTIAIRVARRIWNIQHYLRYGGYGGFQYSECFLNLLWHGRPSNARGTDILNFFQLYPERIINEGGDRFFYLDQTLSEVLYYYGRSRTMSESWQREVLDREGRQYRSAKRVIFRSNWAAKRACAQYQLSDEKVGVVLPGANISQEALAEFDRAPLKLPDGRDPLKLIFVGKEWHRKGLDRLCNAMRIAVADGAPLSLTVVGCSSGAVPLHLHSGVPINWLGFVDKSRCPSAYVNLLAEHDFGVLLSRSEAGGVSLREFGRAGLPVIAPNTGGSPEFAMSDSATLISPDDSDEDIAVALSEFASNRVRCLELKREAWGRRRLFDWSSAISGLKQLVL